MFKFIAIVVFALFAVAAAKPQPQLFAAGPVAYSSPLLASSAVVSREFHGNTSPYVAALPYASAYSAPLVAASGLGYASPYVASPYVASPYVI